MNKAASDLLIVRPGSILRYSLPLFTGAGYLRALINAFLRVRMPSFAPLLTLNTPAARD